MGHEANTMDSLQNNGEEPKKLVAAAAERNCPHIVEVVLPFLVDQTVEGVDGRQRVTLLEVASGTGQHAFAIASALSERAVESTGSTGSTGRTGPFVVQPSDLYSEDGFESIRAYASDHRRRYHQTQDTVRMEDPISLDCTSPTFVEEFRQRTGEDHVDAILCVNMTHIAPIEATFGLIESSGMLLDKGGVLMVYGPFKDEDGNFTTDSNAAFDASLRSRNPEWGYRSLRLLDDRCTAVDLQLDTRLDMPANNYLSIYRKR